MSNSENSVMFMRSKAKFIAIATMVTIIAVLKSCERYCRSRSEYTAAMPAITSTTINSNGCWSITEQISIIVRWVTIAVRESMNTRVKIATMAYGRI